MELIPVLMLVVAHILADKVDEPIPQVDVLSVEEHQVELPCDLSPRTKNEELTMVLWYRSDNMGKPIYWVDWRNSLETEKHWSNPEVFGERAYVKLNTSRSNRPLKAVLQIQRLAAQDAGLYMCRIDIKNNPTRNQRVNLTVVVPPKKPVIYTTNRIPVRSPQLFDQDGELHLDCEVTGGSPPPRVTWRWHANGYVDETYKRTVDDVVVNRLDLTKARRELYGAQLICEASNTHLIPPVRSEVMIDLNLKPVAVNITNKTVYLSALKTYEIECITWGSKPKAVITWYRNQHPIVHMARNFAEGSNMTRSVMSYVPTIIDDNKNLTCRAENPSILGSGLEDKWHLIIHYVPVVTIKLGSSLQASDIDEGDDVYFECEVQANPKTYRLAWFKDGKELHPGNNILMPGRADSLVLQKVTRASAGEYSCMATNDEGRATSRPVTLDVMYAPVCKDGTTTQVVGALKHETISLLCGVQSKPAPLEFHWTFNNSGDLMNVPSNRYTQIKPQHLITNHWHGSRLNYTPVNDADYGTIACSASNKIGTQKVPCLFQIIVAGKPYPLQNCTAVQSTGPYAYRMGHEDFKATDARDANWLIVRCSESFDGGLPITSFEIEVYSDENVYHVNTISINHTDKASTSTNSLSASGSTSAFGPIFEVPGLEPGRNYRLLLYAVNAKGRSDPVVLESVTLKGVAMYTTGRDSSADDDTTDYSLLVACFAGGVTAICILVVGVTLTLYRRSHPLHLSKTQTHLVHCTPSPGGGVGGGGNVDAHNSIVATDDRQQQQHHLHMQMTQHTQARQEYEMLQRRADILKDPGRYPLDVFARATTTSLTTTTTATSSSSPRGFETEDDPDVIPSTKAERKPDIFEPNYSLKPERIKDFRRHLQDEDLNYHSTLTASTSQVVEKDSWLRQNGGVVASPGGSAGSPTSRPSTLPVHRSQDIYTRSLKVQESCI